MSSSAADTAGPAPPSDPFNQNLTMLLPDGTPLNITISDLDDWYLYSVYVSIEYASQLGACLILLTTLVLLTKPDKRHSPIFLLNASALFFNVLRLLLGCIYFAGPFSEAYIFFSGDYAAVPRSAYNVSVTTEVGTVLVLVLVQLSLILQTHVVCLTLRRAYRHGLLGVSSAVASVAVAWRLYLAVVNIQLILSPDAEGVDTELPRIQAVSNFVTTASIFWFSAVFVAKLAHALRRRHRLGLRRWGPMQIIFTMGCQTLVIPGESYPHQLPKSPNLVKVACATAADDLLALFSALQYLIDFAAIGSFVVTLVAIFLPLSSLWAAATIDGQAGAGATAQRQQPVMKARKFVAGKDSTASSSEGTASDAFWLTPTRNEFGGDGVGIEV